jgi:hypothetical protein
MRGSVDRNLVTNLLQDGSLSYREIARRASCSDWSVRAIAREIDAGYSGGTTDDATPDEPLTPLEWLVFGGIVILVFGGICFVAWRTPLDGGPMG